MHFIILLIFVQSSKEGALSKIGESLIKYPELRLIRPTRELIVESIVEKQRSFTTVKSYLLSTMEKDMKETGQCRMYLAKEPWDTVRAAFGLQKDSQFTPTFNHQ